MSNSGAYSLQFQLRHWEPLGVPNWRYVRIQRSAIESDVVVFLFCKTAQIADFLENRRQYVIFHLAIPQPHNLCSQLDSDKGGRSESSGQCTAPFAAGQTWTAMDSPGQRVTPPVQTGPARGVGVVSGLDASTARLSAGSGGHRGHSRNHQSLHGTHAPYRARRMHTPAVAAIAHTRTPRQ